MKKILFAFSFFVMSLVNAGGIEVYQFETQAQENIYKELVDELRCLVCQNQNIAASNAELAQDMRKKTAKLIQEGKTKTEITDFMSQRYGDFVLYKPPFKASTAVLWIGPFAFFFIAIWLLMRNIRSGKQENELDDLSNEQLKQAASLLQSNNDKDKPTS